MAVDHLVTRYNTRFTLLEIDDGSGASIEIKVTYKTTPRPSSQAHSKLAVGNPATHADSDQASDNESAESENEESAVDPLAHASADPRARALLTTRVFETTVEQLTVKSGPRGTELLLGDEAIDVGTVLKIKGTLQQWRGAFQLNLRRAFIVRSLDEEVRVWNEYAEFVGEVLSKPLVLSLEELDRLRRAEMEDVAREKRRAERKRGRDKEKIEKRKAWEKKRERYEMHAEKKRLEEAKELDGNALDRPGWTPFVPPKEHETEERVNDDVVRPENGDNVLHLRENVGITTAKAMWHREQLQQKRQRPHQAAPVRWQHEYKQADSEAAVGGSRNATISNKRKLDPG